MELMQQVVAALSGKRFPLEDEKRTQLAIADMLNSCFSPQSIEREVKIAGGVIDFIVWPAPGGRGIGIEVKLKGQAAEIRRQLERYANETAIDGLVLVTARPMALPRVIAGRAVVVVDLARAWL